MNPSCRQGRIFAWFPMSRLLASLRVLACVVATWAATGALNSVAAQGARDLTFDIVPAAAAAGVARQIRLSVPWPMGCAPTGAVLVPGDVTRHRMLSIRFDGEFDSPTRCGDIIFNYQVTVNVTPQAEGDLGVIAVTGNGTYLGQTTIHTRAADGNRSQHDLTGMWYDPSTYGSGLTFVHGFTRDDTLFGTWYVYDDQGVPRWYTIQYLQWNAGGTVAVGQLFWTHAGAVQCLAPFAGCPVPATSVVSLARVSIVMLGPNSARITALKPDGALTANVIRSIF